MASQMTSKEDNAEMMQAFSALDTDGNGVLSRDELITGYKKLNKEASESEIKHLVDDLMAQVDVNHEGKAPYHPPRRYQVHRVCSRGY